MSTSAPPWDIDAVAPDVAIVIALAEEFRTLAAAVIEGLHAVRNADFGGYDYFFIGPGGYRCVATVMDAMGPTPASQSAQRLLARKPAVIVNIGIAGGLADDLCIGDVIVPREVAGYDETGKAKGPMGEGPWQERRGKNYHPTSALVDEVLHLPFAHAAAHAHWREDANADIESLLPADQRLLITALLGSGIVRATPQISTKHLGSGSFVIASKAFAEWIREANADIHAAEMEAAGMLLANEYRRQPAQSLVIRGISDHVNVPKSEVDAIGRGALRGLAMRNAWRLLCTLMELCVLPRSQGGTQQVAELREPVVPPDRKRTESARPPRVFISYSHDSEAHSGRVLELAQRLRGDGIDAWLDVFDPAPPQGWPRWLAEQVQRADFVVMVCSASYRRGFEGHEQVRIGRAVNFAGLLATQLLYEHALDFERVVPVLFDGTGDDAIPLAVRAATAHVLLREYEPLRRRLTRERAIVPVPLGEGAGGAASAEERLATLAAARRRRQLAGEDPGEVGPEILELRRELRAGPALMRGDVLAGRYELDEQIGRGGFANVWRAYDREGARAVAIKLLRGDHVDDRSLVERFCGGARRLASLRHPAVVPVLDGPLLQDDRLHFFVMPWLIGGDLRRAVKEQAIERATALEAVARALEGLNHVHQRGFVHRDVKPSNILLDETGQGWIADFDTVRDDDTTRGTRTNAGMGTFVYAAPEQLSDAATADARADMYGAAMTVLYVLAGKDAPALVMLAEPGYIDALDCSRGLKRALRGALAYRADERTTSCSHLIAALRGSVERPEWAAAAGYDEYGRWASFRVGDVEQLMRWIEPGSFMMGSPDDEEGRFNREGPLHRVTLTQGFWLAETPCTQALWEVVMEANPSNFNGPARPVEKVSWEDVQLFLELLEHESSGLRLRLPSEAEWEYACRAGTTTARFAERNAVVAWCAGESGSRTDDVGRKQPNAWGLHDMLGNVWEWCADGPRDYTTTFVADPIGFHDRKRVFRGGSWSFGPRYIRAACRNWSGLGFRSDDLGFRLARGQ
jgi:formylglycine-generating enzyme required for sulfatase activity/nucleoside phosphorylase/tRNA A-37 threonylcarbamoyl transferase component Bud32